MTDKPVLALLGTGVMGTGMGANLLAAGFDLRVWNRSPERAAPLADAGATLASSAADAIRGAEFVLTMLWGADSVADVVTAAAPGLTPGAVWIQASTVGVEGAARLSELASRHDLVYVDAPVLGTRKPADDGTLVILASGPDDVRDRCAPVFDAIGSRTMWVGPAGQGSRLKLAANSWTLVMIEGIAECLTFTEALGLDPALFLEAIRGGAMDAPYLGVKGRAMLAGDFTPSFSLTGAAKDAGLVLEAARAVKADVGVLERVREHLDRAVAAGHGDADMAATYLTHRL